MAAACLKTMRILYLTREPSPSFRPDIATLFGRGLVAQGIYTDLVALRGAGANNWAAGQVFDRVAKGKIGRLIARLRLAFDLFTLGSRQTYDAIQVRDRFLGAFIGMVAARWRGLPFFYWMSLPFPEAWQDMGSGQAGNSGTRLQRMVWQVRGWVAGWLLYRLVLPRATHIFVQSEAMRQMLTGYGIAPKRMTPVPMGVEIPEQLEAIQPADDARLAGRRVIVYLGALERIRHPELMLEAMLKVIEVAPDALLVLVGDSQTPGDRQWLEGEIVRLKLGAHAIITGWLAPDQAWRYTRTACMGLSPFPRSRVLEVGSPTKVCEYLAYGIPVIANDQPDQAFLLLETGGGLCVPLTADGFAQGMLTLLADPLRAREMGANGRVAIGKLRSYDVISAQLASRYRALLAPLEAQ